MEWLSRTIAILIFMVGPGLVGSLLDHHFNTHLWTPIGFGLGIVLATTAFIVLASKLVPKAGGKPIPFDDEPGDDESGDIESGDDENASRG